jgi:hypothetical protein
MNPGNGSLLVKPMNTIIRICRELNRHHIACLAAGLLVTGCASDTRPVVVGKPMTLPVINEYCAAAQKEIASARVPARNVVASDFQAFARATPAVQPLETLQFVQYADDRRTQPRMISCKLHSAEKIRSAHGATAAGESSTCARLNRRTLDAVMASLTERQKKKMPFKGAIPILLDPDEQATNEAQWLEAFTMVQTDVGGTLRVRAKTLRGDGTGNVRVSNKAPVGGRQYCHLIAPDYLKRILLGEVQLPKAEFPETGRTASR